MSDSIEVICPCCTSRLTVEAESGEVLSFDEARRDPAQSFDEAMNTVRSGSQRREDAFSKAFKKTQRLDDILDKKFEEAKKKAEKDKGKPHNPFDLD